MLIQNKKTKAKYTITKEAWENFPQKKIFKVLDAGDNTQQMIENIIKVKPSTGETDKEQKTITIKKDKK